MRDEISLVVRVVEERGYRHCQQIDQLIKNMEHIVDQLRDHEDSLEAVDRLVRVFVREVTLDRLEEHHELEGCGEGDVELFEQVKVRERGIISRSHTAS